jgi:hypothetical protein
MSRFAGESRLSNIVGEISIHGDNHDRIPEMIAKKMKYVNISTHFQMLSPNHSVWIQTPLSGHYQTQRGEQFNCTLQNLTQLLGKEGGEILWTNGWFIPLLTLHEWGSNDGFCLLVESLEFPASQRRVTEESWTRHHRAPRF